MTITLCTLDNINHNRITATHLIHYLDLRKVPRIRAIWCPKHANHTDELMNIASFSLEGGMAWE